MYAQNKTCHLDRSLATARRCGETCISDHYKIMRRLLILVVAILCCTPLCHAQASAIPSAAPQADSTPDEGRKLLAQMVAALGGDKWLNRSTWVEYGQTGHFYKSTPDPYTVGFEEYNRAEPFAQRVVFIEHTSALAILGMPGRNHQDVANIWNDAGGWELSYKGKKSLPKEDVDEFERVRRHSLEVIVKQWLKQPGTIVTYEGSTTVDRRLAQKVAVLNDQNDSVEIALEDPTNLPLSITFKARNPTYKDFDTEILNFADYHEVQGIQTPYAVSHYKNGDLVSERFITKVDYSTQVPADLFDPDHPPPPNAKK